MAGFDGSTVTLQKTDGTTVAVKGDLLSKEDMAFILSHPLTGIGYDAVSLAKALPGMKEGTPAPPVADGILVVSVFPTGPAEKAGLAATTSLPRWMTSPPSCKSVSITETQGGLANCVVYRLGRDNPPGWQRLDLAVSVSADCQDQRHSGENMPPVDQERFHRHE